MTQFQFFVNSTVCPRVFLLFKAGSKSLLKIVAAMIWWISGFENFSVDNSRWLCLQFGRKIAYENHWTLHLEFVLFLNWLSNVGIRNNAVIHSAYGQTPKSTWIPYARHYKPRFILYSRVLKKGHLILKCRFDVFTIHNWPKNQRNFWKNICPSLLK